MLYKNTKTGAVIFSASEIKGGDWVPLEEKKPSPTNKRKKTGEK